MNLRRFLSRLNSNSRGVIWEKDYRYYSRNNYTNCWHSVWKLEFVGIGLSDSIKQSASSFCGRNPVLFSRANVGAASVDKKMRLVLKWSLCCYREVSYNSFHCKTNQGRRNSPPLIVFSCPSNSNAHRGYSPALWWSDAARHRNCPFPNTD